MNNIYGNRDALDKASEDFAPVEMIDSASLEALDSTQEPENSAVSPELVTVSQSDALDTISDNSVPIHMHFNIFKLRRLRQCRYF